MALPKPQEARLYYRAAKQRYDDAVLLLEAGRTGDCDMAVTFRTKRPDERLKQIAGVLEEYGATHPRAEIEAYRQNSVSVRVRIIDPTYAGKSRAQREEGLWKALERLPEDVAAEISMLLLLTPDEAKRSFASVEFDDPVPSKI